MIRNAFRSLVSGLASLGEGFASLGEGFASIGGGMASFGGEIRPPERTRGLPSWDDMGDWDGDGPYRRDAEALAGDWRRLGLPELRDAVDKAGGER